MGLTLWIRNPFTKVYCLHFPQIMKKIDKSVLMLMMVIHIASDMTDLFSSTMTTSLCPFKSCSTHSHTISLVVHPSVPSIFWATHSPTLIPQQAHSHWDRIRDHSPGLDVPWGYFSPCACVLLSVCSKVYVCVETHKKQMDNEQELWVGRNEWDRKAQRGREVEV